MSVWDIPGLWEAVQKDWRDGLTLTQIASRYPGLTRGGVAGRLHRKNVLKDDQRTIATRAAYGPVKSLFKKKLLSRPAVPFAGVQPTGEEAERRAAMRIAKGKAALVRVEEIIVESPNARPFLDAPRSVCKWPIGEGLTMLSCCNQIHRGSYCEGHSAIAYSGHVGRLSNGNRIDTPSAIEHRAVWYTRFDRTDVRARVSDRKLTERPVATPWDEARAA